MDRNSSNGDGPKSKLHQIEIGRLSKSAETPKGNSLSKVQLGRYVQVISLDISTLSEPLRWAFTLIGGMPPCLKLKNRKSFHPVPRCFHTHTPPEGGNDWNLEKQTPSTDQKSTVQTES